MICGSEAFASHASAARLLDLPVPVLAQEHVSVRDALRGLRCAAPLATSGQPASMFGLVDLVVVGDHLVRLRRTTVEELQVFCAGLRGSGAALARRAASYVRTGVDSPMETRLRMLLVLAGIPEPRVNLTLREVDGKPVRRFDLS